jgi:hypothetical protein
MFPSTKEMNGYQKDGLIAGAISRSQAADQHTQQIFVNTVIW